MNQDRRAVLAALGLAALPAAHAVAAATAGIPATLAFRPFEDGVREAFRDAADGAVRRVEVGHADLAPGGLPGCVNDRPFAGFAAGRLRIVRVASGPGPAVGGVRLYVATVEVASGGDAPGRPLDFAGLPPAPVLAGGESAGAGRRAAGGLREGEPPRGSRPQPGRGRRLGNS